MREIKKVQFNEKGIEEKKRKKEINRFRFLLIGAFLAFFVGIAVNFFYDLIFFVSTNIYANLLKGGVIVAFITLFYLLIDDNLKDLDYILPKESKKESRKEFFSFCLRHFKAIIKILVITFVVIACAHYFIPILNYLKNH